MADTYNGVPIMTDCKHDEKRRKLIAATSALGGLGEAA
jgi:hypothetical protein